MHQTGATWLQDLSWAALAVAFACAAAILYDVLVRGYRQHMAIMNLVWPITALYWGPVGAWFYFRRGRRMSHKWARKHDMDIEQMMPADGEDPPSYRPFARKNWWPISKGVSHCGAGCTLGDIAGDWIVWATGLTIGGFALEAANELSAMFILDFAFAWTFGIAFQYFSIAPMREDIGKLEVVWAAINADTLSIVAFQVGLFGYMALYHLYIWQPPLGTDTPTYWFMMQVGMVVGFFTAWPVNMWLVRKGWKEKM